MHMNTALNHIRAQKSSIKSIFSQALSMSKPQSWILRRCRERMNTLEDKTFPRWAKEFLNGYREALHDAFYVHLVHAYLIDGELVPGEWNNMTERQREYLRKTPDLVSGFVYRNTMLPYSDDLREHLEGLSDEQVG